MGDAARAGGGGAVKVDITIDTSKFDRLMADFPACLARARKRALQDIGQHVASRATLAFRTEALRPSPWAPRKASRRDDGHPLLIRSGTLRQSISWRFVGDDAVVVGSGQKYARYHQFGTKRMPARPFFPIDGNGGLVPAMERKIKGTIRRIFADEMRRIT